MTTITEAATVTECQACEQPTAPDMQGEWIACPITPHLCIECCACGQDAHTFVEPARCIICHQDARVALTCEQAADYDAGTRPLQDYAPALPREVRELLISGTHPQCWAATFGADAEADR